jgi:hypothetical protein
MMKVKGKRLEVNDIRERNKGIMEIIKVTSYRLPMTKYHGEWTV